MNEISETIKATILGLAMQTPEIPAQRKFVSAAQNCGSYSFDARNVTEIYCSQIFYWV